MCAIFGILGPFDPAQARRALSTIAHRGPDYCGIVEQKNLFFAHNRLSIIDLRATAHQPMRHKDVLLSFNGEIYNYRELRERVPRDRRFRSRGDVEVVLKHTRRSVATTSAEMAEGDARLLVLEYDARAFGRQIGDENPVCQAERECGVREPSAIGSNQVGHRVELHDQVGVLFPGQLDLGRHVGPALEPELVSLGRG